MIVYFSGTGNSRYIAKYLGERLNDEIKDATQFIKRNEHPYLNSEKPFVFVSPTYAWRLPRVFEKWIKRTTFSGNEKAYFILNCGSGIGSASKYAKKLSKEKGLLYNGMAKIIMPENYIAMFSAPTEEKAELIIEKATKKIDLLVDKVSANAQFDRLKWSPIGWLLSGYINNCFYKYFITAKKFYTTDACTNCGECIENCMLNNVTLANGKVSWGNNCTHCMSCICKCPTSAIEYGKHTKKLRRYVCTK